MPEFIRVGVNASSIITARDLSCARDQDGWHQTLSVPALAVEPATVTLLTGGARSGKDLLLRLLGLLEVPEGGDIDFEGQSSKSLTESARSSLRNQRCGYVFASPFLLPSLTVIENIAMPLFKICRLAPAESCARAEEVLAFVGLQPTAALGKVPLALQRRVALARALATRPAALFVENLDALVPEEEPGMFRRLLHRAAQHYLVGVVASASPLCPALAGERRIELSGGRMLSEICS